MPLLLSWRMYCLTVSTALASHQPRKHALENKLGSTSFFPPAVSEGTCTHYCARTCVYALVKVFSLIEGCGFCRRKSGV